MRFWDGIACADSAPKENAAAGEKSERPAEQPMSLDETLPAESKGGPEPSVRSVSVISTVLTSSAETVQMSEGDSGMICESEGATDGEVLQEVKQDGPVVGVHAPNPPVDDNFKSLQSLLDKYMVYFGDIEFDRISPGNNPRIVRDSGVKIIKDSILNSGWDDSTVFIISVVSEDENLLNPEKVKSDASLLAKILEHCAFIFVNGHHRDKARKLLIAEKFEKFPLPTKGKCMVCTGISKWDHFLISKKANFVSCAAAPDTIYDKICAVDRAIEQFDVVFPKMNQVEKKVKLFFETEVGEKTISAASFNLYFNLAKLLSTVSKDVLRRNTEQCSGEFLNTDSMKYIVSETKKNFKDNLFMAQKYHVACIDCMYRYYVLHASRMSSTFFPRLSAYVVAHVIFYGSVLTQVADSFQMREDDIELPGSICNWFKTYLDNFDVSDGGLENVEIFLDSTAPLLASNSGHLPHDLRQMVNRHVAMSLKKDPATAKGSKKRAHAEDAVTSPGNAELVEHLSDEETFTSPTKKGKKVCRGAKPNKSLAMDTEQTLQPQHITNTTVVVGDSETDTDAQESVPIPYSDPATKYRHHVTAKHLQALKSSWIGPDNCTVNTDETDTVEKARTEWIQVHGAPFDPKGDKLSFSAAFVCLDVREPYDYEFPHTVGVINATAPKLNRGGCFIIIGTVEQVGFI